VESELGEGSRFHFSGNFKVQKLATRTVIPRDPATLCDMRVLVVDDNATNRQILVKMLEGWRMVPTVSESGAKAMVTLTEAKGIGRTFPLILLDAQMPEMDGFALAEYIKRHPSFRAATIMMLSSAGQRGDAMRCRELGVSAYLTKPVRQSELMDAILTALGTRMKNDAQPALITRHSLRESQHRLRGSYLALSLSLRRVSGIQVFSRPGFSNWRRLFDALTPSCSTAGRSVPITSTLRPCVAESPDRWLHPEVRLSDSDACPQTSCNNMVTR